MKDIRGCELLEKKEAEGCSLEQDGPTAASGQGSSAQVVTMPVDFQTGAPAAVTAPYFKPEMICQNKIDEGQCRPNEKTHSHDERG